MCCEPKSELNAIAYNNLIWAIIGRLSIANLTETSPAFMADAAAVNTDPGMYDLFGRSYTLSFSLQY